MNKNIADQLFDNDVRVAGICHIGYMSLGEVEEPLQDMIDDFWDTPYFSSELGLSDQERGWLDEISETDEIVQFLINIGKTGFLIVVSGDIYEQHITDPDRYVRTASRTSEIAYAHTAADIDQAILSAFEHLKPRLRRPAKAKR